MSVENVLGISMPSMPCDAVLLVDEEGIALIVVDDGIAIAVAGAIV